MSSTKLKRRIFRFFSLLFHSTGLISAVLTILTFLGLSTITYGLVSRIIFVLLLGIAVILVSALLFILFYTLLGERSYQQAITKIVPTDTISFPEPPLEETIIMRKEIVYEYLPDGKSMLQRKHIKLRGLQNRLTHHIERYRWTGGGTCKIRSLTSGYTIENERVSEEGIWNFFDVVFPNPLHKDEIVEFTVEWELVDEKGLAIPFLSTMVDRETEYLLLQVSLPDKFAPARAYFYEYGSFTDTLPILTKQIFWSPATKCLTYEIYNPVKDHKFLIRWYPSSDGLSI